MLLTSSAEKALDNSTVRDVGMLLSPKAYRSLNSVEIISPRIMIALFNGNPAITIISCYSPTSALDEEDKDQFYFDLTTTARSIPKHNITLVGGAMNARFGKKDARCSAYNNVTNENGKRQLDYMQECRLQALNTRYRKREGKLLTYTLPCGKKSQIDSNTKWKNSALNCETCNTFSTIASDQRIVTTKLV